MNVGDDKTGLFFNPIWKPLAAALFWLAVWAVAALLVNKEPLLPAPWRVAERLLDLVVTLEFWAAVGASLLRICLGFVLAILAGMALAGLMHWSRAAYFLLSPLLKVVRATPVVSFIILALVWFTTSRLPVFISFLMVLPVSWANTLAGLANVDLQLLEMAALFKVSRRRLWKYIYWPSLYPYVLAACGSGLGLAWKAGITAEVIASPLPSIGSGLQAARVYIETADVFVWTLTVIVLSIFLEKLVLRCLRRGPAQNGEAAAKG